MRISYDKDASPVPPAAAVSSSGIAARGADPQDFPISNNTCGSILGGEFKPVATGARSATLDVSDGGGGSP